MSHRKTVKSFLNYNAQIKVYLHFDSYNLSYLERFLDDSNFRLYITEIYLRGRTEQFYYIPRVRLKIGAVLWKMVKKTFLHNVKTTRERRVGTTNVCRWTNFEMTNGPFLNFFTKSLIGIAQPIELLNHFYRRQKRK